MSINSLLSGVSNTSSIYQVSKNLITKSTSMESQIYSAVQEMTSSEKSNSVSEKTDAAYMSIDSFLKTYQSDLNELEANAEKLLQSNKENIFNQYESGKAKQEDIVSAVQEFVDSYNSVTALLEKNEGRGAGTASHLSSFLRGIGGESTLEAIGITYDSDRKMQLDTETLKKALDENYDTTAKLIGGQYGVADRAMMKADQALADSVQRIVSNDLNDLISSTQNYNSIQYTNNFSKAGAYNLSNMYVVGLFVNMTV